MEVLIDLFNQLTSYFHKYKDLLPEAVDLDVMTLAPEANLALGRDIEHTEYNVEINFRGALGNPVIQGFYDITIFNLKVTNVVKS